MSLKLTWVSLCVCVCVCVCVCLCIWGESSRCLCVLCSKYLYPVYLSYLKSAKFCFSVWQKTRSRIKGDHDFTSDNYLSQAVVWHLYFHCFYFSPTAHTHTHTHTHICLLNCPNIPLPLPPEKDSACYSCQWDFWVFNSPQVNPPAPQIDLISNGAKKDNLHIHGETEQCWLNLMRVTFKESRGWFALISVKCCPYRQKTTEAEQLMEYQYTAGMKMNAFTYLQLYYLHPHL